ncbi:hypothetical protein CPB83DRAFT_883708 [Crepidotus variabilis]|uniref:S-adenosylmethionine-dependent methyltransferase n=1 Tax=Crepidotus variabilis TaxID=179855 RepID=A0A9P6EFF4_9AGAR|nr:hypothetical protein CPB83DRAFT_883708 [Crepidotus variabilis]
MISINTRNRQCFSTLKPEEFNDRKAWVSSPVPPTAVLPPLWRLNTTSTSQVRDALSNLRRLYFTLPTSTRQSCTSNQGLAAVIGDTAISLPVRPPGLDHAIHDTSVPDSGYASAEEEEDEGEPEDPDYAWDLEVLCADPLERAFSIKWLTGFMSRLDMWVSAAGTEEEDVRMNVFEDAIALLSLFNGNEEDEDIALTRTFLFPLGQPSEQDHPAEPNSEIPVELNDAPLSKIDHTSVGLQSWGSCILFAEKLCAQPSTFGLCSSPSQVYSLSQVSIRPLRILELGAGTGMLSIAADKVLQHFGVTAEIVATDYHPDVLANLEKNVDTNLPQSSHKRSITVTHLDWEHPPSTCDDPHNRFADPFDTIFAADIVYHPSHALWIKQVVERFLRRDEGVFWLFIPIRTTGRHEGVFRTVEALFPSACQTGTGTSGSSLSILGQEAFEKREGTGRADEAGYLLFKIGWLA